MQSTLLSVSPLICFSCPTITHHPGTKPSIQELLRFTCADGRVINIPVEIGYKYVLFGIFLLNDRTGSRVKIIAHKYSIDAELINTEILQQWLIGGGKQPVTWATLVEVLHDIEFSILAYEIEAVKCSASELINCTGQVLWSSM